MGKPEGKTSLNGMTELPDDILELQRLAFRYFLDHTNAKNGLVADNTREDSPCSIAATGLGLSCHPVAVSEWLAQACGRGRTRSDRAAILRAQPARTRAGRDRATRGSTITFWK